MVFSIVHFSFLLDLAHFSSERFGGGTGPVFIDYIHCNGSEWDMWRSCSHFSHHSGCSHNQDVGVQCKPGKVKKLPDDKIALNFVQLPAWMDS